MILRISFSKKQKINFDLLYANLRVDNPMGQFRIVLVQNNRFDNAKINIKPSFFENGKLVYNHVDANVFDGLNEYRRMDIRTVRFLGEHVASIDLSEGNNIYLTTSIFIGKTYQFRCVFHKIKPFFEWYF